MLIASIYKIEFKPNSGATIVLLDHGDKMTETSAPGAQADAPSSAAIGANWGNNLATGGAQRPWQFTQRKRHASPQAAWEYCMSWPARLPFNQTGELIVTIEGGSVWEILRAVLLGAPTVPVARVPHTTLTSYSVRGSITRPVSEIALFPGIMPNWINQTPATITAAPSAL